MERVERTEVKFFWDADERGVVFQQTVESEFPARMLQQRPEEQGKRVRLETWISMWESMKAVRRAA